MVVVGTSGGTRSSQGEMVMSKPKWKDTTSYRQGERASTAKPRSWEMITMSNLRVIVHRHIDDPYSWFLSCYDLRIEKLQLNSEDIEEAKEEAIQIVRARLQEHLNSLPT